MKNLYTVLILAALLGVSLLTVPAMAQEMPEMSPQQMAEMEAWQKAAILGEQHQMLAKSEGSWNFTSRWMSSPDAEPMESSGTAEKEMVLGGRYLKETIISEWLGEPFEGVGYIGYDNVKKTYVSIWFDTMSTGMMLSDGTWDPETKTLSWKGEYIDALTGELKTMHTATKIMSNNKHVAEFYHPLPEGGEYKSMEIVYTRK